MQITEQAQAGEYAKRYVSQLRAMTKSLTHAMAEGIAAVPQINVPAVGADVFREALGEPVALGFGVVAAVLECNDGEKLRVALAALK